jgi:hypothetical protein
VTTWGDLSGATYGELQGFTWGDLEATPPAAIESAKAFLVRRGWSRQRVETTLPVEFWGSGRNEVMVPVNPAASDFARRWLDLLRDLSGAFETPLAEVSQELWTAGYDVLEVRAAHGSERNYTIALTDAVDLLTNVRSMVVAASCSTIDRRAYHGKSRPKAALDEARVVRMGQTKRGSYVIPILSPVADPEVSARDAEDLNLLPEIERELYPRRVMRTLATSLSALHSLGVNAGSVPSVPILAEAVSRAGVSAELSASVAGMLEARDVAGLDFGLRWSLLVPTPSTGDIALGFPKASAAPLREITDRLRDAVRVRERIVYGRVTQTARDEDETEGVVTVRALVGTRARPIRVRLNEDDFHVATLAIDEKRRIVMSGSLTELSGHTLTMTDLRYFRLDDTLD